MKCPNCGTNFKLVEGSTVETVKPIVLTEFQEKIVNCRPEINKPVFILTGIGCGKTIAFNERAKNKHFLYYGSPIRKNFINNCRMNIHTDFCGYEEIVFEIGVVNLKNTILSLIDKKRLIVCTNPIDFINNFADRLKGEYTIISGYNMQDNPFINSEYEESLLSLSYRDRERLYYANWGNM